MSVKISELPILDSLADNDVIAGVDTSANVTSKIEMATLKNYIDTNTQYTAGTNIDITNNVVSAPNVYNKTETDGLIDDLETNINEQLEEKDEQIEELQKELDVVSTIYNAFPTESGEGESLILDDTAEVKFKKFDLEGNTSQDGTPTPSSPIPVNVVSGDNEIVVTGKNLLEGIELGDINSQTGVESTNTTIVRTLNYIPYDENKRYYFSVNNETPSGSLNVRIYNKHKEYIGYSTLARISGTMGTITKTTTVVDDTPAFFRIRTGVDNVPVDANVMVSYDNDLTYEPYIGNTYPIYLGVENLLDLTSLNPNQVGQQVSNIQENSFIMSGTAVWGNEYFFYENTNKNTTYTASCKYLSSLARKSGLSIYGTNETTGENLTTINSLLVDIPANVETPVTNTFNSGNYDYIVFRYWNNATATALSSRVDLYVKEVQLEQGSKANSYTPYGTTPIELCKIGTYQDYIYKDNGSWYLHKEIGKVVLDGTNVNEYVNYLDATTYSVPRIQLLKSNLGFKSSWDTGIALLNKYSEITTTGAVSNGTFALNFQQAYINIFDSRATDIATARNILIGTEIYIIKATPTNTLIEDTTLIEQLEEIKSANSYEGQTNISQENNDKPFILDVTAIKSLQNVLDRIELLES